MRERQIPHDFTHVEFKKQNKEAKGKKRGKTRNRLLTTDCWLSDGWWVRGCVKWVIGIKECTCDEHWELYRSVESLYGAPETIITLYVN